MIAWSIIPALKGVVSGIHSCTVLITLVVGLSNIPKAETNDRLLYWAVQSALSLWTNNLFILNTNITNGWYSHFRGIEKNNLVIFCLLIDSLNHFLVSDKNQYILQPQHSHYVTFTLHSVSFHPAISISLHPPHLSVRSRSHSQTLVLKGLYSYLSGQLLPADDTRKEDTCMLIYFVWLCLTPASDIWE